MGRGYTVVTLSAKAGNQRHSHGEISREFCGIRLLGAVLKANTRANSEACSEIPYATEQGIILEQQGILSREQGIWPAKSEIVAG
jgi:hypothetical protein